METGMFLDYYGMNEQPFGVTPDPRYLYLGQSHLEALASLYYGVESDRGFVALIAEPGLGKTTLAFQLLQGMQQDARTVFLFQTQCNSKELFHYLLNGLGVDAEGMELVTMHNKVNEILSREMLAGRRFILAIDEAQNLDSQVLETIRLLSNFETSTDKLLQILLIGQPQLARKLASPELEQLQQRISVFATIKRFGFDDTCRYIAHRLQVAGYTGDPLFSNAALRIVAEQSQGIPRKINALCFSALSLSCAMNRRQVDAGIMEEVIADRDVEANYRAPKPAARPVLTAPAPTPAPVVAESASLTSYLGKAKRILGRWSTGVACLAACAALGAGILSVPAARIDRIVQASSDAWTSVHGTPAPTDTPAQPGDAEPTPAVPATGASATDNAGVLTVIVQPGETLSTIALRELGSNDEQTLDQVRKLNPDVADLEHLAAGEAIRLPLASAPNDSAAVEQGTEVAGKNPGTSHIE
jgi:general secretion pathway protein A